MKRLLTILLFMVCVFMTILIFKIDDYAYVICPSQNNLSSDNINNKLENIVNSDDKESDEKELDSSVNDIDIENNNNDKVNNIEVNEYENKELGHNLTNDEIIERINKYREKSSIFVQVENVFQTRNSNFIPWEKVVYDKDVSYKYDEIGNLEWIEVNDKKKIFENDLKNYKMVQEILGEGKINKRKSEEFNYNYYELTYKFDDINIRFLSYYESGSKNICIID